jgi:hypothetical protein
MALRQCDQCSEMVDEAKAFCPGCGSAFVNEERAEKTSFQKLDNTVQFGQTMYNQMLEDMGLNISDVQQTGEKRVETITPLEQKEPVSQPLPTGKALKPARNRKWYILGGVALLILLPVTLVSVIMIVMEILGRLTR